MCPTPSKVKFLKWFISLGKMNTNDRIQPILVFLLINVCFTRMSQKILIIYSYSPVTSLPWSKLQINMGYHGPLHYYESCYLWKPSTRTRGVVKFQRLQCCGTRVRAILGVLWMERNKKKHSIIVRAKIVFCKKVLFLDFPCL